MTSLTYWMVFCSLFICGQAPDPAMDTAPADEPPTPVLERPLSQIVRAELRAPRTTLPVGGNVMVEFALVNLTDEPVKLEVPGALTSKSDSLPGMGLPLEHVFSGVEYRGLLVASDQNPIMGDRVTRKPQYPVPSVTIAPFGSIGLRFDVARFYPGLHQAGIYRLGWQPYGGALEAEPLIIEVVQYKQVMMETDFGPIVIELLYDKAPNTVGNFLDLVQKRFYNGKTFHMVYPGQFILGGCPVGDGTGRRPDGMTIPPEFNDTPFEEGTVAMALVEGNPHSASCQFFICLSRQPSWDGEYTAFGRVKGPQSLAALQKLGQVEVDENHAPAKPLKIKSMTSVDLPYSRAR